MLQAAYDPAKMGLELRGAEEWIAPHFEDWEDRITRYVGPGFREEVAKGEHDPESFAQEWMSLMAPQCTLGNPRARVSTSRLGSMADWAQAHEYALNRWIKATKARNLNEKLVADYGFRWAVTITLPAEEGEYEREREDPRGWPVVRRVSPKRFLWDVLAEEREDCRWMGHKTIEDKEDLVRRAGERPDEHWNVDALQYLTEGDGIDEHRGSKADALPDRGEVLVYHVWVPEYEPTAEDRERHDDWDEFGVHGAWLTIGRGKNEDGEATFDWVRAPYPYWGRRKGPYSWFGTYVIPDEPSTLSPIAAVQGQDELYNDHARAMDKAMGIYKRGFLVDGTDPDWEDKIREFEDSWVVALEGLDKINEKVMPIELGGVTDLHMAHNEILRTRRNRTSGITDTMRGNVRAGTTATAEAVADEKSDTRTGWQVHKFRDGVQDYLEAVSWYLEFDPRVTVELVAAPGGEFVDTETGEPLETGLWRGGTPEGEGGESWEDPWDAMGLEIEPFSMEKTSEALQQQRVMQMMEIIMQLVPAMAQFPFVHWDGLIQQIGEALNVTNLGDHFDMRALAEYREMMMQMGIAPTAGSAGPQPRLGIDLGGRGMSPAAPQGGPGFLGQMTGAVQGAAAGVG